MMGLRECPFCGKSVAFCGTVAEMEDVQEVSAFYYWYSEHYQVVCDYHKGGCGAATSPRYETPEDAIAAWNRRATDGK